MADGQPTVEYRDVPDFRGYRVGSDGSVWSCHNNRYGIGRKWRQLSPIRLTCGYPVVSLRRDNTAYQTYVHHLVAMLFIGERPPGMEVCHNDGCRSNNVVTNLRYDTHKGNMADTVPHGTFSPPPIMRGVMNHNAKLTVGQVQELRAGYIKGSRTHGSSAYARKFGVRQSVVWNALRGATWSHVIDCE